MNNMAESFRTDGQWPQPEDARGMGFDQLQLLTMQIICPHADTSKHKRLDCYPRDGGTEYCNLCGATRTYLTTPK